MFAMVAVVVSETLDPIHWSVVRNNLDGITILVTEATVSTDLFISRRLKS